MNKILGIVAEYNPFHNGHLFHLNESKKITNCDFTIAVMSGNFIQRGDPAILDKWTRTKMALDNGVDLVIELPTLYAISSAENFSYGAVKILNSINVDYISFGSELGEISQLENIAQILNDEPKEYLKLLSQELNKGISYPKARENALTIYTNNAFKNIIASPNNILGIEYLKALKKLNSKIIPITIKRNSVDYNSKLSKNGFASATGIRNMILEKKIKEIKKVVPQNVYNTLSLTQNIINFEKEIFYILKKMDILEISNLPDVSEGLEFKVKKALLTSCNLRELISNIKSKRYTETRIKRILLYALLEITKKDMENSFICNPYIRVLGINENGKKLLSKISKENPNVEIITSVKKFLDNSSNDILKNMLKKDILSSDIYGKPNLDYTKKIVYS